MAFEANASTFLSQVCQDTCSSSPYCQQCDSFRNGPGFGSCSSTTCGNYYPSDQTTGDFSTTWKSSVGDAASDGVTVIETNDGAVANVGDSRRLQFDDTDAGEAYDWGNAEYDTDAGPSESDETGFSEPRQDLGRGEKMDSVREGHEPDPLQS